MNRALFIIVMIIFWSLQWSSAFAQHDDYMVQRVEDRNFARQDVTSINQDREGFIWFGTESGLFRYDAHSIVPFQSNTENPEALPNDRILDTYKDPDGTLWISTHHSGLSRYNPLKQSFQTFNPTLDDPDHTFIEPFEFSKITGNADPYLWLIPVDRPHVYRFNTENETFREIELDFQNRRFDNITVSAMVRPNNDVWIGTIYSGIIVLNSDGAEIDRIRLVRDDQQQRDISYTVISMINDNENNRVWIGTHEGGVFYYDLEQKRVVKPEALQHGVAGYLANVYDLYLDEHSMLWAGTDDGLLVFNTETMQIQSHYTTDPNSTGSLVNNRVRAIYQDESGLVWIGNEYGGTHKLQRKFGFITINEGPLSPVNVIGSAVRTFTIFEDELWVAVQDEGIFILDYETFELNEIIRSVPENPNSLTTNGVTRFLQDPDGGIWIGTWGGLNYYNPETGDYKRYLNDPDDPTSIPDNRVQVLFIDSDNRFWVGTEGGLALFDREEGTFETHFNDYQNPPVLSHPGLQSLAFIEDEEGVFWIGTWDGLNRYDPDANTIRHYQTDFYDPNTIQSNRVISLLDDHDGTLWIGTFGGGLSRLDKESGIIKTYKQIDGLSSNVVFGILPDNDGYLWLSTTNGLSRFDPQREFFITFDRRDGILSDEFWWGSAFSGPDGRLMFGSTFGFTIFDPSQIIERDFIPPIRISSVIVFDQPVFPDSENHLELSFRDNLLTIEFAALDYANSSRIEYAYMLEGVDRDWNYSGNRNFATYSFLRGGDYTFYVRATDSNGVWLDETAVLTIRITPPFWQNSWFQFLVIGLIIFFIWFYIRNRSMQMMKLNQKLEREVAERTKDLAEKQSELLTRNERLEIQAKQLIEQKEEIEAQKETILQKTRAMERTNKNLVELNEDKNNLIGLVSHDLRGPLATVLGAVQLFKEDPDLPEEQKMKMLDMLEEMMEKQLQMVSKILDIDSIETGRIKLQLESVDVVETTKAVIARHTEKAGKKEIDIVLNVKDEDIYIQADKNYLGDQVFGNLLSNALKFSPVQSKVEITVFKEKNSLRWGVSDQGPGVSEKDKKKLFGKYQKLSARPTGGEPSTGLGLSIVKRIVEEMEGRVWCESKLGYGATFWVEFQIHSNNS